MFYRVRLPYLARYSASALQAQGKLCAWRTSCLTTCQRNSCLIFWTSLPELLQIKRRILSIASSTKGNDGLSPWTWNLLYINNNSIFPFLVLKRVTLIANCTFLQSVYIITFMFSIFYYPEACFSKVPKLLGPISGATIPFISSQRRGSKPPNFAKSSCFFLTLKTC